MAGAPVMTDYLSAASAAHFEPSRPACAPSTCRSRSRPGWCAGSTTTAARPSSSPPTRLEAAQNAVGGGGRYDGLVEEMGGPPTPGIGFALGVERTLLACDAEGVFPPPDLAVDVFVVDTTGGAEALALTEELRAAGLRADRAFDHRSMKSQMKSADRSGAALALLVGPTSRPSGTVTVRALRGAGEQEQVPRADIVDVVRKKLDR